MWDADIYNGNYNMPSCAHMKKNIGNTTLKNAMGNLSKKYAKTECLKHVMMFLNKYGIALYKVSGNLKCLENCNL